MELTKKCSGCMACYNKCPQNAITIVYSEDGFYVPAINHNLCVDCGLCKQVCPQERCNSKTIIKEQECYAVVAKDEIREKSSSGGVFAQLALFFLEKGGYVCGAAFCDDFKKVEHIIINKKEDLIKLQGSKYVQSNINKTFTEIKKLLLENKLVLFSGTPCQVAGLKAFLGKDYDNLYTVDVLCHGIPSPIVWEKYVKEISKGRKVSFASFRNKKYGWYGGYKLEIKTKNNHFIESSKKNLYYRGFLEHLILNESCYDCKYTNLNRPGDFTLGDFWGISKCNAQLDDKKGISSVLLNTQKAKNLAEKIKGHFSIFEPINLDMALEVTPRLRYCAQKHKNKEKFVSNLKKGSVVKNLEKELLPKYDGIIKNFWGTSNFGASLSAYAIQQFFQQNGKNYYILNNYVDNIRPHNTTMEFAKKYLKLTKEFYPYINQKEISKWSNNFVLGTDQVIRGDILDDSFLSLLGYLPYLKNRITFSASFGRLNFATSNFINYLRYSLLIKRFDAISTREDSGVKIAKSKFNIKAEHIIDPIFLIDKQDWYNIMPDVGEKYKGKIVAYFLGSDYDREKIKKFLREKLQKETVEIINGEIPVEEFLSAINSADYILTNSFHAMSFSLLFNKKVMAFHQTNVDSRFYSLVKTFNVSNLLINHPDELYKNDNLFPDYDYNYILSRIEEEKIKAKKWFDENVGKNKKITISNLINEILYKIFLKIEKPLEKLYFYLIKLKYYLICNFSNKKIVFWGASLFLEEILQKNPKLMDKVVGIVDTNPEKYYKKIGKCTIYPLAQLNDLKPDYVIMSVKNKNKVVYQKVRLIMEKNFPNIKLFPNIFERD